MFNDIKVLHLETTTTCNAACPQCARENPSRYNHAVNQADLSVTDIQKLFNVDFVKKLDKVFACGNFGDPAAGKNTIEIFRYFRSVNPNITLGMNTNGSVQNVAWWSELGSLLSKQYDYCVFSIDGLEDTNHIYRVNTRFDKIIENAQAFIAAGGLAHWDMLVFEHNQDQVNNACKLAKKIGFTHFRSKVSKRFVNVPVVGINPPKGFKLPNVQNSTRIDCHALKEKSLYVAATGEIFPCCWIGSKLFKREPEVDKRLKDFDTLFKPEPLDICWQTCGVSDSKSSFENQWTVQEAFG
jgi:hypothetical protein